MSVVGVARMTFCWAPNSMSSGPSPAPQEERLAGHEHHHELRRGLELGGVALLAQFHVAADVHGVGRQPRLLALVRRLVRIEVRLSGTLLSAHLLPAGEVHHRVRAQRPAVDLYPRLLGEVAAVHHAREPTHAPELDPPQRPRVFGARSAPTAARSAGGAHLPTRRGLGCSRRPVRAADWSARWAVHPPLQRLPDRATRPSIAVERASSSSLPTSWVFSSCALATSRGLRVRLQRVERQRLDPPSAPPGSPGGPSFSSIARCSSARRHARRQARRRARQASEDLCPGGGGGTRTERLLKFRLPAPDALGGSTRRCSAACSPHEPPPAGRDRASGQRRGCGRQNPVPATGGSIGPPYGRGLTFRSGRPRRT
jgi:hypothetical protein